MLNLLLTLNFAFSLLTTATLKLLSYLALSRSFIYIS